MVYNSKTGWEVAVANERQSEHFSEAANWSSCAGWCFHWPRTLLLYAKYWPHNCVSGSFLNICYHFSPRGCALALRTRLFSSSYTKLFVGPWANLQDWFFPLWQLESHTSSSTSSPCYSSRPYLGGEKWKSSCLAFTARTGWAELWFCWLERFSRSWAPRRNLCSLNGYFWVWAGLFCVLYTAQKFLPSSGVGERLLCLWEISFWKKITRLFSASK